MNEENLQQDGELPEGSAGVRIGRELQRATVPFAVESVAKSWWHVGSTFVLLFVALAWLSRTLHVEWPRWTRPLPAYAIGTIAMYWLLERVLV